MKIFQIIKKVLKKDKTAVIDEKTKGCDVQTSIKEQAEQELNRLYCLYNDKEGQIDKDAYSKRIGKSFLKITKKISDDKVLNVIWIKYVSFSWKMIDSTPDVLMDFIDENNYRRLFNYAKKSISKQFKKEVNERVGIDSVKAICERILQKYDHGDIPALMLMGQIYRAEKDYRTAQYYYGRILDQPGGINGITALADCYKEEICDLRKEQHNKGYSRAVSRRINELREKQRTLYENSIQGLSKKLTQESYKEDLSDAKTMYVALNCKFARWEKTCGNYQKCMDVLNTIPEDYPEYHRVMVEKGLLYQYKGDKMQANPYYNLSDAEHELKLADQKMEEYPSTMNDRTSRKSVLVPLANTLFSLKKYSEAEAVCQKVLNIDPNEQNAVKLKEKIENMCKLTA